MHFARQGVDPNNDYLCSLSRPFRDGKETSSSINEFSQAPAKAYKPTITDKQQETFPDNIQVSPELPTPISNANAAIKI